MNEAALGAALGLVIVLGVYWVVYSVVLYVLMKMQGWHVGPIALLGSTALATVIANVIPIVGPYAAAAVLAICIWKASGSDLTDSIFSVVIASALMFAFQMFALTALMGKLEFGQQEKEDFDPNEVVQVEATSSWTGGSEDPLLYLKGITLSSNQTMVLVGSGTDNYSFTNGEIATIRSDQGRLVVTCELIETNEVIMKVQWKERTYRVPLVPSETLDISPGG